MSVRKANKVKIGLQKPRPKKRKLLDPAKKSIRSVSSNAHVKAWVEQHENIEYHQPPARLVPTSLLNDEDVSLMQIQVQQDCPLKFKGRHVLFVNFSGQVRVSKVSYSVDRGFYVLNGSGNKTVRICNSPPPKNIDSTSIPTIYIVDQIRKQFENQWSEKIDIDAAIIDLFSPDGSSGAGNHSPNDLFVPSDCERSDTPDVNNDSDELVDWINNL